MVAAPVLTPDLLRQSLVPLVDASTAFRLFSAARQLYEETSYLVSVTITLPRDVQLDDAGFQGLVRLITKLKKLQSLSLSLGYQQLGWNFGSKLAAALSKLCCISNLAVDVRHTDLGDEGISALAQAIPEMPQLSCLDLRLGFNRAGCRASSALAQSLKLAPKLTDVKLELDINRIGDQGVCHLISSAIGMAQLKRLCLDLSQTGLTQQGAHLLATILRGESSYSFTPPPWIELDVRGNNLKSEARKDLAKGAALLQARGCHCTCRV